MPVIVVGGSGRGVGKTALMCELIAAFPAIHWTAVKITSHAHGKLGPVWEESVSGKGTDTARYLAAGAKRALLVTAHDGALPINELLNALENDANVIFESNSVLGQWKVDLCIAVIGSSKAERKQSFVPFLERADAFVVPADLESLGLPNAKPVFRWGNGTPISPAITDWLCERLRS
jgi:hypothetical protein